MLFWWGCNLSTKKWNKNRLQICFDEKEYEVITPVSLSEILEVKELETTERNEGGFGSTGYKWEGGFLWKQNYSQ